MQFSQCSLASPARVCVDIFQLLFSCSLRWIFWLDTTGSIERVGVDGRAREVIRSGLGASCIQALTLDFASFTIYWTNRCSFSLESVRMDGNRAYTSVTLGTLSSIGVSLFNDFLYWTDSFNQGLYRVNRTAGTPATRVIGRRIDGIFGGVEVVHPSKQPEGESSTKMPVFPCQFKSQTTIFPKSIRHKLDGLAFISANFEPVPPFAGRIHYGI